MKAQRLTLDWWHIWCLNMLQVYSQKIKKRSEIVQPNNTVIQEENSALLDKGDLYSQC